MSEFQEEEPIKASSKTIVTQTQLNQYISFYYTDPTEIYYSYIRTDLLEDLIDELTTNMQRFVSQDTVLINGEDIPLGIVDTHIEFHKNKRAEPVNNFSIKNDIPFNLKVGENVINLEADVELLEYPISSVWRFPGKVLTVKSPLRYKISGFNVFLHANATEQIGGKETFIFTIGKRVKPSN